MIASCNRRVGLRRLGVRGRSLWLEGRRWVPRGVACVAGELEPAVHRELLAAAWLDDPAESVCESADEAGIAIIARCGADPVASCRRWAEHASVMLATLPCGTEAAGVARVAGAIKPFQGTMLLGLEVDGGRPPMRVPDGIDCLMVSLAAGAVPHEAWREPPDMPMLASRPSQGAVRDRREACDRLQADLAAWRTVAATWDWAGYLTSE